MGKRRLKKAGLFATIAALMLMGKATQKSSTENTDQQKDKTEIAPPQKSVKNSTLDVPFFVDTLDVAPSALAFCSGTQIVRYFVENDARYSFNLSIISHENKHRDNVLKGLRALKLSPLQYAKMCMHDEISASMCELLTLRYEYLAAQDKQAYLEKAKNGKFGYYFHAVAEGRISPERQDEKHREAEWRFIAQETKAWWMRVYAPIYLPSIMRMTERYLERMNPDTPDEIHNLNYQKVSEIAYNIGGVDFGKYMGNDIQISDEQISMIDKVGHINLLEGNKKEYYSRIKAQINRLKEKGHPLSQEMLSHIFLAEGLKTTLKGIDGDILKAHPDMVTACYERIKAQLSSSPKASKFFNSIISHQKALIFPLKTELSKDLLSEIYTHRKTDLTQIIQNFNTPSYPYFMPGNMLNSFEDEMLKTNLSFMRHLSKKESQEAAPAQAQPPKKSRKSPKQTITAPDFSQPILTNATPEQTEQIYQAIRDFYNIPVELRGCDLKQQALYYQRQKTK